MAVALGGGDETDDAVAVEAPEEWGDDEDEWDEKIDEAYRQAEILRSKEADIEDYR